jgi:hypothetical protein
MYNDDGFYKDAVASAIDLTQELKNIGGTRQGC